MDDKVLPDVRPVHVARQPIFDTTGAVFGYELLFRADAGMDTASAQGAYATSQVLVNTCTEFGLGRLGSDRPVFVNLTREFLVGELPLPFEPGQAVLEILETVPIDDEVSTGVRELVARGYAVALDDFVPGSPAEQLIGYASYVKIDVLGVPPADLARTVAGLDLRPDQWLLAERVETVEELEVARRLGFRLFQGYLFARPEMISGRRISPSRLRTLRLLELLTDPAAAMDEITNLVSADPALSYRLLTAANSAAAGGRRRISSVRDAAVLVGAVRLREWLMLMLVADLTGNEDRAASVLIQARFCQEIAARAGLSGPAAFTVGLLDALCDLTGEDRTTITEHVPLSPALATAVTAGQGPFGWVLTTARQYQRGGAPPGGTDLAPAFLTAVSWTYDLTRAAVG